jgi:hypothetical protein
MPKESTGVVYSDALGLAKMKNQNAEAIVRTRSQPKAYNRRYLGPTILHFYRQGRNRVGTVPILCSEDLSLKKTSEKRVRKLLDLFSHYFFLGMDPLNALYTGYVPVLHEGPYLHFPAELLATRCDETDGESRILTQHKMQRFLWRGLRVALREAAELLAKNLLSRRNKSNKALPEKSSYLFTREVILRSESLILSDTLEGPMNGRQLKIGIRYFDSVSPSVEGLSLENRVTGLGSDGLSRLDIYGDYCDGNHKSYTIIVE